MEKTVLLSYKAYQSFQIRRQIEKWPQFHKLRTLEAKAPRKGVQNLVMRYQLWLADRQLLISREGRLIDYKNLVLDTPHKEWQASATRL